MIEYQDELRRLNSELRTAKQDYDNAADFDNEVDMEIAENYVEKLECNIDVIKKAEALDDLLDAWLYERTTDADLLQAISDNYATFRSDSE